MGWCSGTEIFDDMIALVLSMDDLSTKDKKLIVKRLLVSLEKQDYDCHSDSSFYDNDLVKCVVKELHPDWFDDTEEAILELQSAAFTDGSYHKQYAIIEALKLLMGEEKFNQWKLSMVDEYGWGDGIAP